MSHPGSGLLIAVDVGGSSSRSVAVDAAGRPVASAVAPGARKTDAGIAGAVVDAVRRLVPDGVAALGGPVVAVAVGATGLGSLSTDRPSLAATLTTLTGCDRVALAADALTAHLGALDGEAGAVLAVGTGVVALGRGRAGRWRRADGWGHLLGDRGGAAWLGAEGLRRALEAFDGRSADGAALLAEARALLGDPTGWPRLVHERDDPATLLASVAGVVTGLADGGDAAARGIVAEAGRSLARAAGAVLTDDVPPVLACVGGVSRVAVVDAALRHALARARPDVRVVAAAGDPLAGSVALARSLTTADRPGPVEGLLWT
ncbi:BadF/BadG/BcrA/BcrD ATPase family protein [Cellulomonas sp. ATA003]|uniref:N-acetylglucosamine kinase n=1 Tax=Cellulomonas sp. ATA003 TaxID=3073064 RepID=UPI002872B5C4|nr:BadF/BadG/BcrA/BcrD ATPase family protein [Cellulomonas sp. ATA003]WNB86425.1 BadF/BadG/BcrA/BcrD ATPase family protein [Cellulomonas sp. ATA003]